METTTLPAHWNHWVESVCSNGNHRHVDTKGATFRVCLDTKCWWPTLRADQVWVDYRGDR